MEPFALLFVWSHGRRDGPAQFDTSMGSVRVLTARTSRWAELPLEFVLRNHETPGDRDALRCHGVRPLSRPRGSRVGFEKEFDGSTLATIGRRWDQDRCRDTGVEPCFHAVTNLRR